MESKEKVELLRMAIKQLIEEEKSEKAKISSSSSTSQDGFVAVCEDEDEESDDHRLLSKLLSQLESLREDGMLGQPIKSSTGIQEIDAPEVDQKSEAANEACSSSSEVDKEDIVKEIKKVGRQNLITHCLLSVMIVLTVAWQLSEVSLILKVKDGLSHPFKSFGSMVTGILKAPAVNGQEEEKPASAKQKPIFASSLPGLKIPELPHMELPDLDFDNDEA